MSSGEENRQVVRETFFSLKVVISWLQRVYSRRSEAKWVMRFEIKNWNLSILLNNARKIDPLLKLIDELQLQKHTLAMQFCSFAVLGVVSLRFNSKPLIYYSDIFVKVSCSFFCLVPPKGSLEIAFELKYIRKFSAYRILAHGLQLFPAWASVIVFKILSPETKKKKNFKTVGGEVWDFGTLEVSVREKEHLTDRGGSREVPLIWVPFWAGGL